MRRQVVAAIRDFLRRDRALLIYDVNERSITHKLAGYLQARFRGWDVDCEYNRNHDDPKRLKLRPENVRTNDTQAQTVFPDIIVHKRHTDENLLVIEVKKSTNNQGDDHDLRKLEAFKQQLGYKYAAFLKLEAGISARLPRPFALRWDEIEEAPHG
jgi:hypothetical protein